MLTKACRATAAASALVVNSATFAKNAGVMASVRVARYADDAVSAMATNFAHIRVARNAKHNASYIAAKKSLLASVDVPGREAGAGRREEAWRRED